jgi:hypothetical protein
MITDKELDNWFLNLNENIQQEIIENIYPDDIIYDNYDAWRYLDYDVKLEIWEENQ